MEIRYSAKEPAQLQKVEARIEINYGVKELTLEEIQALWEKEHGSESTEPNQEYIDSHRYSYNVTKIGNGRFNYSGIVEAIIRDKYTADKIEAITNNMMSIISGFFSVLVSSGIVSAIKYLVDSKDSGNSEAFKEMQEWRALAKQTARALLKME